MTKLEKGFSIALLVFAAVLPLSIAFSSIVFFPLAAVWLGTAAASRRWRLPWGVIEKTFVVFLAISILASVFGMDPVSSLIRLKKDMYFVIYLMMLGLIRNDAQSRRLLKIFLISSLLACVLGLLQYVIGVDQNDASNGVFSRMPAALAHWPRPILDFLSLINGRVAGTRSHPLTYAECLLFAWGLVNSAMLWLPRRFMKRGFVGVVLIGLAVLLSQSRGPWIAGALMFFVSWGACYFLLGRFSLWPILILLFPVAVLVGFRPLQERAQTLVNPQFHSNQERLHMWHAGWVITKAHPLLGIGPGCVRFVSPAFQTDEEKKNGAWGHLHNTYINFAAERGILGLLAFCGLMAAFAWTFWKRIQQTAGDPERQFLFLAGFLALLGFTVTGLTEVVAGDSTVLMVLYFFLGTILAVSPRNDAI